MGIGRLPISVDVMPRIIPLLSTTAMIIGSFTCVDRKAVLLAIEHEQIRDGARLTAIVTINGLTTTVEIKEID